MLQRIKIGDLIVEGAPFCTCLQNSPTQRDFRAHREDTEKAPEIPSSVEVHARYCKARRYAERVWRDNYVPRREIRQSEKNTPISVGVNPSPLTLGRNIYPLEYAQWLFAGEGWNIVTEIAENHPEIDAETLDFWIFENVNDFRDGPCSRIHRWIPSVDIFPDRETDVHAYAYPGHQPGTPYAPRATPKKRPEDWYDSAALAELEAIGAPLVGPGNPLVAVMKRAAVQAVIDAWHKLKYEPTSRQRKSAKAKAKRAKARGGRWGKDGTTYHA